MPKLGERAFRVIDRPWPPAVTKDTNLLSDDYWRKKEESLRIDHAWHVWNMSHARDKRQRGK